MSPLGWLFLRIVVLVALIVFARRLVPAPWLWLAYLFIFVLALLVLLPLLGVRL
jgi:hypothetical protein